MSYQSTFRSKSALQFQKMFEASSTPPETRALVLKQELFQMNKVLKDGSEEEKKALKLSTDMLPCLFRIGLRSIVSSSWTNEQVEDIWMSLMDVLTGILATNNVIKAGDEDIYIPIVDSVMTEVRCLLLASTESVPYDVQVRIIQLLSEGCRGAASEGSSVFVRACLAHLILVLLSMGSVNDQEWLQGNTETAIANLENVVTSYTNIESSKRGDEVDASMVSFLNRLCFDFDMNSSSLEDGKALLHENCLARNAQLLVSLFPILVRLVTVKSPRVRASLQHVLEGLSRALSNTFE